MTEIIKYIVRQIGRKTQLKFLLVLIKRQETDKRRNRGGGGEGKGQKGREGWGFWEEAGKGYSRPIDQKNKQFEVKYRKYEK